MQANQDGSPFTEPPSFLMQHLSSCDAKKAAAQSAVQPVQNFLQPTPSISCELHLCADAGVADASSHPTQTDPVSNDEDPCADAVAADTPSDYVPADVISKWGQVLDIVTPQSHVTNCFTKTYTRFAKVEWPCCHGDPHKHM